LWLVLRRGVVQAGLGLALGALVSLPFASMMPGGLDDMRADDPAGLAAVTLMVVAVALLACAIPARRASRVDPVVALRAE
jgi:putative ABC transport system permease protein